MFDNYRKGIPYIFYCKLKNNKKYGKIKVFFGIYYLGGIKIE